MLSSWKLYLSLPAASRALLNVIGDQCISRTKAGRLLGWLVGPDTNGHYRVDRARVSAAAKPLTQHGYIQKCGSVNTGARTQTQYRRRR